MPPQSRRARLSVIDRLLADPQSFSFSQAVRLLERATVFADRQRELAATAEEKHWSIQPVAKFSPPTKESIRFFSGQKLKFPESEIESITLKSSDGQDQRWHIVVNFIGLTGALGVMPFHYSELILRRLKARDPALAKFMDLFNHRTTSLFFQASNKYRLPIEYERSQLHRKNKTGESTHTSALLSLLGLGTGGLRQRQLLPDESLIFYSGLFTQQARTANGMEQIIESYFDVPVKIEGFIGQWQDLIEDVRSRLPCKSNPKGQNVCLGRNTMLGKKGWFAQGKTRIKIGPLNKEQFHKFAPGTSALKTLNEISSSYLGMEENFDFVIEVTRADVPNKIELKRDNPPMLAWNAWLAGKPKTATRKDDLLEISVSSKKLQ